MTKAIFRVRDLPAPPAGRHGFPWDQDSRGLRFTIPWKKAYPKITVVTPSFNQGNYLEETIRSVLLQGYPNLEYIVIDGGSSDESVAILRKYDQFLTFWVSERDTGQANAINKGFQRGSGAIMGWLNSDDILLPGALFRIAGAFRNPSVKLVTGMRKVMDSHSRFTSNFIRDDIGSEYYLTHYCTLAQETTYWRREVWERIGPLDEHFHFALDYEYWLRAIKRGNYRITPIYRYLGGFRDYAENKTNSWMDVLHRDLRTIYRRYDLGEEEASNYKDLGEGWITKFNLYVDFSKQGWTNHPRLVQLVWKLFEDETMIVAAQWVLAAQAVYQDLRTNRKMARLTALRQVLFTGREKIWQQLPHRKPETNEPISYSEGWYPAEEYAGEVYHWSQGNSSFGIAGPFDTPQTLTMVVKTVMPSERNQLHMVCEDIGLDAWYAVHGWEETITIPLPPSAAPNLRFLLTWSGDRVVEAGNGRILAFRFDPILVEDRMQQSILTLNALTASVQAAGKKSLLERIPVLGSMVAFSRLIDHAPEMMRLQRDYWEQMAEDQAILEAHFKETVDQSLPVSSGSPRG